MAEGIRHYNGQSWTFTWKDGRQLATAKSGDTSVSYNYDAQGLRTSKTVGSTTYYYVYLGDQLVRQTWGSNKLDFAYDEQGRPYSMTFNGTTYFYVLNLQGDVIWLVDASGAVKATYTYDAWGNAVVSSGALVNVNPLRYRGYYYDFQTQMYYLNSRYFDPANRRFISADSYLSTDSGITGYNMFSYCINNPVNIADTNGHSPQRMTGVANAIITALKKAVNAITNSSKSTSNVPKLSAHNDNRRPYRGRPGSTYRAPNGDTRTYGPDGTPQHDYDHDDHGAPGKHPHDENGGHNHDWQNGVRGPAYSIGWEPIAGASLVAVGVLGSAFILADDMTGIGIADNFLLGSFGALVSDGLILIWG